MSEMSSYRSQPSDYQNKSDYSSDGKNGTLKLKKGLQEAMREHGDAAEEMGEFQVQEQIVDA